MSNAVLDMKLARLYGNLPDLRTEQERKKYRELVVARNRAKRALREQRNWRRVARMNALLDTEQLPGFLKQQVG